LGDRCLEICFFRSLWPTITNPRETRGSNSNNDRRLRQLHQRQAFHKIPDNLQSRKNSKSFRYYNRWPCNGR